MHKPSPKTARLIFYGTMAVGVFLYLISRLTGQDGWAVATICVLLGGIIFDAVFYRCPACGRYLGRRFIVNFCPWCGEDVDNF